MTRGRLPVPPAPQEQGSAVSNPFPILFLHGSAALHGLSTSCPVPAHPEDKHGSRQQHREPRLEEREQVQELP